eukprot:1900770-Alexandrium_andersonii.AAC.1
MEFDSLGAEPRGGLERNSVNARKSRQASMPLEGATSRHVLAHSLLCGRPREAPWGLGPRAVE